MPFLPTWKTAKTTFETKTHKKKPSEKFLGVFRKGTGIEDSLKKLDAARKGEDIRKALAGFKAAYTNYLSLLLATASDPKSVKPDEKATYVSATNDLKSVLQKIEADAQRVAEASSDVGDKEVTTADTQLQKSLLAEAQKHIALREQVLKDATALNVKLKSALADLNNRLALAEKQKDAAKEAGKSGNTMMHQVAVGVIDRHIDEGESIVEKNSTLVRDFTKEGSPMMKARADLKDTFDKITGPLQADMKGRRDKPWGAVTQAAAEQNTIISSMKGVVEKMKLAKAKAEASGSQMKSPQEYLAAIGKTKGEIDGMYKSIKIKIDRVVKSYESFDAKIVAFKGDKAGIQQHCRVEDDQAKRYSAETIVVRDRIANLGKTVRKMPSGAFEDGSVEKAVSDVEKVANDCVSQLNKDLKDATELQKKIMVAKSKYK
ncbi:hypothetical protein PHYC_03326 [Phycisphaerales bacterium]|nr:hypothetical protein PHYC_03326 [Phycisphaerales bacterium]